MREFDHTELTAYPMDLFDRNMTDGRMMMVSCLTLVIGHNHAMGDIKQAKIHGLLHA